VAGSIEGEAIYCDGGSSATLSCCDLYRNAGGDWVGPIADQLGVNGNIALDPLFCNDAHIPEPPLRDEYSLTLHADSPCAAENNPECGQIGAWPVGCPASGGAEEERGIVEGLAISSHPNPFSTTTRISCVGSREADGRSIQIEIYDTAGRLVRTLTEGTSPVGGFETTWDGTTDAGEPSAGGIYFIRVQDGYESRTERVVLLR